MKKLGLVLSAWPVLRSICVGGCLVLGAGVAQAAPILLKSGTIDPQGQSGRPKARLMAAGASAAKGGLYIIQHEGAIPSGWRRQLRAAGARIRVGLARERLHHRGPGRGLREGRGRRARLPRRLSRGGPHRADASDER